MPIDRTSRPEPQANGPHLSASGYSEKQCRPPCRSPRERRPEDQTTDAMDIEVPETRFRGRSQALLYNNERPHQALNMRYPAERYVPSTRPYRGLPDLDYPFHDKTVTVTSCGRICFNRQKINLSTVFAGQSVGIKQVSEEIWLISQMDSDLGYFDHETCRLEPLQNPFDQKCWARSRQSVQLGRSEPAREARPKQRRSERAASLRPTMTGHDESVTYVSG